MAWWCVLYLEETLPSSDNSTKKKVDEVSRALCAKATVVRRQTREGESVTLPLAQRHDWRHSPLKKTNFPSLFSYAASIFAGRPLQNTLMSMG